MVNLNLNVLQTRISCKTKRETPYIDCLLQWQFPIKNTTPNVDYILCTWIKILLRTWLESTSNNFNVRVYDSPINEWLNEWMNEWMNDSQEHQPYLIADQSGISKIDACTLLEIQRSWQSTTRILVAAFKATATNCPCEPFSRWGTNTSQHHHKSNGGKIWWLVVWREGCAYFLLICKKQKMWPWSC